MKVITLYNPWADWVMLGVKRIETRLHNRFACLEGQWIGIHAGLTWEEAAFKAAEPYLGLLTTDFKVFSFTALRDSRKFEKNCGKLLGIAHVAEARWLTKKDSAAALIDCEYTRRFGLIFDEVEPWKPRPVRGHQGIWNWEHPLS